MMAESVFVNVFGAQESIPPTYVACRTAPPGWESIPGLLKMFTNTGSGGPVQIPYSCSVPSPHRMFKNSGSDKTVRPVNTIDTLFLSPIDYLWFGVA
jgi:hypothetical protein